MIGCAAVPTREPPALQLLWQGDGPCDKYPLLGLQHILWWLGRYYRLEIPW